MLINQVYPCMHICYVIYIVSGSTGLYLLLIAYGYEAEQFGAFEFYKITDLWETKVHYRWKYHILQYEAFETTWNMKC